MSSASPTAAASGAPFLDSEAALAPYLPQFEAQPRIAIDTEADSLHCYFEKLCLIQISIPGNDLLIDPLAGFSLEPLFGALAGKELIFHGADYDLRLLRRVGFAGPARIFDTMIAARLCGLTEFSLAALIEKHFGVKLAKASQKANWARRPLSPEMAAYAAMDTRYLFELADIFTAEIHRLGRWEWFVESCARAVRVTETSKERDNEEAWRITGSGLLRGRAAAILRELWRWRDQEARAQDRPAFHILHNEQLIDAATRLDSGERVEFRQLHSGRLRRFEAAIERALLMPESEWPTFVRNPRPRPTKEEEARFRELKTRRDRAAEELKIDASLIAPKATMESLAVNEAETAAKLMPWQRTILGV